MNQTELGAPPAVEDVIAAPPEATEPMSGEVAPASAESSRPVGSSEPLLESSEIGSSEGFEPLTEVESD